MADKRILTVSQTSELVKMLLEGSPLLKGLTVKGEISNLTVHRSGHLYFSLKDEGAIIRAVMFRAQAEKLKFLLKDGMKVLAGGKISVYPPSGSYQLVCDELLPDGIGALQLAFEQLKEKLSREGLFDKDKKKPIPKIPRTVGVITSPTGAAIRDILQISQRRFPFAKVILYPAAVQGELAPEQLIRGVQTMDEEIHPDVIIIGRGGGSAEDLWSFNDENLVRAVAACQTPIISAIGHEIDFTLCDFAADLRAPTPSAAAELAFPDTDQLLRKFENVNTKMEGMAVARLIAYRQMLERAMTSRALTRPGELIRDRMERLALSSKQMERTILMQIEKRRMQTAKAAALLDAMSPLAVLARGYAVASDTDGIVLTSVKNLDKDQTVSIRLTDGRFRARIQDVFPDDAGEGDRV